jgi:broad specificity phosphatase PhoE
VTEGADRSVRVILLRHGQVANHRGDVPITDLGVLQAEAAGEWFATEGIKIAAILTGETARTISTGASFVLGFRSTGGEVPDPTVSFALRNPDLYLGGHRINMAEGAEALAAQSPPVNPDDVAGMAFYKALMEAKDRVGFWLEHGSPPGDTAPDVGRRIDHFVRSIVAVPTWRCRTIVAITHSPVLRAVRHHHWGEYSKEPPFLHGYSLTLEPGGELQLETFTTSTGDIPTTARPGAGVIRPEETETT